ncbi:MAG: Gfo/Idh/MocA family oxidoreductase [Planctomycetaceae bacterium]|nr:Gfo/Idh/MocA family oxidoreductase [Planctomycetaceae bacterium]
MKKNTQTTRRAFLKTGALTAAAAYTIPQFTVLPAKAQGANDRIGVGFIGTGGRCRAHIEIINQFKQQGIAEPVAVCDVYRPRLQAASEATGGTKMYMKHEELLQNPDVDLVCVASPDAHHAPQAIDALNAGKDVYCEKPLTHWNQFGLAKKIQEAADKTGKLVQVGTQYMADDNYAKVRQMIQDGIIGKPVHASCGYFRRGDWGERMHIPDPNAKPGPDLDWDRFLGDSPKVDFSVERFFQWRLWWDYAGGPSTDLLVHVFTPVFCILDLDFPERVFCGGGTFQYDREVPDQCNIIADYKGGPSVVMQNSLSHHTGVDTLVRGTEGVILWKHIEQANSPGIRIVPNEGPEIVLPWSGMGDTGRLWKNLLDCVKTRQQPFCSIDLALKVQAPLSMGVISHRESKVVKFDPVAKDFST